MKKIYTVIIALFVVNGVTGQTPPPCVPCLPQGIAFNTQDDIDNFQVNYPGCTEITGDVVINGGDAITDLSGLNILASVGGSLNVVENNSLLSLSGLDGLTSVGYWLNIVLNNSLENLEGLGGLSLVGGGLVIQGNNSLTKLSGLDSINASSVTDLRIIDNPVLSACDVKSICQYLANPGGTVEIHDNAAGCNSQQEVKDSCAVAGVESFISESLKIYPNPASSGITVESSARAHLSFRNLSGQQLLQQEIAGPKTTFDVSHLPSGIYLVKVVGERGVQTGKMVKW